MTAKASMNPVLNHLNAALPVVWCVGGVDSSGGAGVTRDAITLADLNVHACVLTTQLTVQSNAVLLSKETTSTSALNQQWQVLFEDTPARAIKIGAIANDVQALLLCARIQTMPDPRPFVVWDPVLSTSSGGVLSELSESVIDELLNTVDIVTPNIDELAWLTHLPVSDETSMLTAINRLMSKGAKRVYVKCGHAHWQDNVCDIYACASHILRFNQQKYDNGNLRGTGCMLASALAAFIVHDYYIEDALTLANAYVSEVRRHTLPKHCATVNIKSISSQLTTYFARTNGFPSNPENFPLVTFHQRGAASHQNKPVKGTRIENSPDEEEHFPALSQTHLGIYPVVDSVQWIARLWPTGVKIMQLRVKHGTQEEIRQQIKDAIELVEHTDCQLFINDYWELAIELGAYGVHLGQEDIDTADLNAIRRAGLRLGISTHGFAEIQRVRALNPSYIALGHIFPTKTKDMPSKPQGVVRLKKYVQLCDGIPTVAIGGINLSRIGDVAKTGVNGIAVVSAITQAERPLNAYQALAQEAGFA
ncbi:thiamine phosphate synthase [Alteromonas sp. S015]|uniref:thiamine phosphate synthase n=1 Tax=Alteromonas sp. S015 TaxID=3117401 RepID=UPI002FDFB574